MNDMILTLLVIGVLIPIIVYFSVKLGRYAYLRADQLFKEDRKNGEA